MSRNNENAPLTGRSRVNGSRLTAVKPGHGEEFFTDSILDLDTTRSSRIPTPSPHKNIQAKQRRARRTNNVSRHVPQIKHRVSASESSIAPSPNRSLQPTLSSRRSKSPSPLRASALATPPQSRDGLPYTSPQWHIRSPPPRGLPDVYQQIADEEDLAATEREFSDQEAYSEDEVEEPAVVIQSQNKAQNSPDPQRALPHSSRASTPNQQQHRMDTQYSGIDRTETASDPTGMSFAHQLSDRNLAAILTPHFSESARNRAKLRQEWQPQKPVAFTKASKPRLDGLSMRDVTKPPEPRVVAFRKATRQPLDGRIRSDSYDSLTERPESGTSEPINENHRPYKDIWHNEGQPLKPLPINARVDRKIQFSRVHGFSNPRTALTEQNLEQQNKGGRAVAITNPAPSSLNSHRSEPPTLPSQPIHRLNSVLDLPEQTRRHSQSPLGAEIQRRNNDIPTRDSSQLDWAAAAADVPLPTIEDQGGLEDEKLLFPFTQGTYSPDKSRRWENDFTGLSFQVSESPPVRKRLMVNDQSVHREIESVSRRAVTTSRLGEIHERNPHEQLRNGSQSPLNRSASRTSERTRTYSGRAEADKLDDVGVAVPNTPAVVFRSSSHGSTSRDVNFANSNGDRDNSRDVLQRLARASSNTPKSSPPAASSLREIVNLDLKSETVQTDSPSPPMHEEPASSTSGLVSTDQENTVDVAQTPRVVGAWTDTILPDTVRTVKQADIPSYVQTPHVIAGGWIDTPAPVEKRKSSYEMSPIVEEVLEELINDTVKAKVEEIVDDIVKPANSEAVVAANLPDLSKVGLEGMLDRAKQRRILQQDSTTVDDNDSLNLGSDTISSLQDYLAQDVTMTGISIADDGTVRLDDGTQADPETLLRLSSELNRIANTVRGADQGISKIERAVSEAESCSVPEGVVMTDCQICTSELTPSQPHAHIHNIKQSKFLPTATLTLSFSIPFLFHPRGPTSKSKFPRPTLLGWITIIIWSWYITECTMSELYSRPEVAEQYTWPTEPEPEFPYVLPTMICRWTRLEHLTALLSYLLHPIWTITVAIWRMFAITLGLTDGFVDTAARTAATATKQVAQTITAMMEGSSVPDLGMMNDEFL